MIANRLFCYIAKKYILVIMLLVIYYFLLSTIAMQYNDNHHFESTYPKSRFSGSTEARAQAADPTCQDGMEEMIAQTKICKQCKTAGNVPVNGVCKPSSEAANKCLKNTGSAVDDQDTTCGQCTGETFMYKGGCYSTADAPGNVMCKTAANGKCTETVATKEYFIVPGADNAHQSVVACGDAATGVTLSDNKQYVGIEFCTVCDAPAEGQPSVPKPATCTKCASNKYLKTETDPASTSCVDPAECKATTFPKADDNAGNRCVLCGSASENDGGIANCVECTLSSQTLLCTKCTSYIALDQKSCVDSCSGDNVQQDDAAKKCKCADGFAVNADGNACIENPTPQPPTECTIVGCKTCSTDKKTCEECESGKHLTPTKEACLAACPAGSYSSGGACVPCDPSCAECSAAGAERCTACPAGRMLRYADEAKLGEGGRCVAECAVGADGCAECGLAIGGTKYCSKCSEASQVPLNGVCASNAARAQFCTTASGGACSACAAGYFIQEGGCYKTDRLPGKSVCTTESGGKCQACANGQQAVNNVCPLCDPTCKTCEAANTKQCKTCFSGYYLDANKVCKKCSETSGNIQGVENCISCLAPTSPNALTPVTCYVTQTPTVDPTGPSVNKGGLSSGAIAGISVAAVVVGGLVGFLCWWFVCRGKA
ncbi:Variant-specific surface protein [Giardia duodenalis]|uniref:Variant-specific surface protein n=1 Tax=Giardia intestinalis TaxID=5741 RepID=V6U052_GIAIN|nr:Variant-specific surface protein [Giardia intestinalis]